LFDLTPEHPGARGSTRLYWHKMGGLNMQLHCSRILHHWLRDAGSLTARLIAQSHGQFRVEVLFQGFDQIRLDERRALAFKNKALNKKVLNKHHATLVREVILYGNNQPWVFARSLLPLSSLTGRLRQLRKTSHKPLGAFLFKQPHLQRSPIEIAKIHQKHHYLPEYLHQNQSVWGRRSVFFVDQKPLMVSEVFLPDFVKNISE
jgi:chorismate lyase